MIKKMDKKESTASNFIPKDLDIICILERDEKHILTKLYAIEIFTCRQISHKECIIDAIEEQRFHSTTSESSGQERTFFQRQAD